MLQPAWYGLQGSQAGMFCAMSVKGGGGAAGAGARQKFSPEEDALLANLVKQFGMDNWRAVAARIPGRTARQCRERFRYYLEPSLNKSTWTEEDDRLLTVKYTEYGPKWAKIALCFANRTPVDLKNRYHLIQRTTEKNARLHKVRPDDEATKLPSIDTFLRELSMNG